MLFRSVEQAWNEPLILGAMVAMIYLVTRGRPNWAVVCLGAALVTKQYAWIVVPFAAYWKPFGWRRTAVACLGGAVFMLPWAVADWHAFSEGSIVSLIQTSGATGAHGSTALFLHYFTLSIAAITTRHGHEVPVVLTVAVTAVIGVLALRRLPRNAYGFALGTAATLAAFDLFSTHSFFNQWWLVTCLVTVAVACAPELVGADDRLGVFSGREPSTLKSGRRLGG